MVSLLGRSVLTGNWVFTVSGERNRITLWGAVKCRFLKIKGHILKMDRL